MLCLPIPGIEEVRDPRCRGNIFGGEPDDSVLSGGPPGAEMSLGKPEDGGGGGGGETRPTAFGDPCFSVTGTGGGIFSRTGVRWRSSDRTSTYLI